MSESKVPQIDRLPDGLAGWVCRYQVLTPHGWIGAWDKEAIEWYGDARAAEARRKILIDLWNALPQHEASGDCAASLRATLMLSEVGDKLRAIADEASPKQVSG